MRMRLLVPFICFGSMFSLANTVFPILLLSLEPGTDQQALQRWAPLAVVGAVLIICYTLAAVRYLRDDDSAFVPGIFASGIMGIGLLVELYGVFGHCNVPAEVLRTHTLPVMCGREEMRHVIGVNLIDIFLLLGNVWLIAHLLSRRRRAPGTTAASSLVLAPTLVVAIAVAWYQDSITEKPARDETTSVTSAKATAPARVTVLLDRTPVTLVPHDFVAPEIRAHADGSLTALRFKPSGLQHEDVKLLAIVNGWAAGVEKVLGYQPLGFDRDAQGNTATLDASSGIQFMPAGGSRWFVGNKDVTPEIAHIRDLALAPKTHTIYFTDTYFSNAGDPRTAVRGRLFVWQPPATADAKPMLKLLAELPAALSGVALSPDGDYLVVADETDRRLLRYWLTGPRKGVLSVFVEALTAYPRDISVDNDHRVYWVTARATLTNEAARYRVGRCATESAACGTAFAVTDAGVIATLHDSNKDAALDNLATVNATGEQLQLGFVVGKNAAHVALPRGWRVQGGSLVDDRCVDTALTTPGDNGSFAIGHARRPVLDWPQIAADWHIDLSAQAQSTGQVQSAQVGDRTPFDNDGFALLGADGVVAANATGYRLAFAAPGSDAQRIDGSVLLTPIAPSAIASDEQPFLLWSREHFRRDAQTLALDNSGDLQVNADSGRREILLRRADGHEFPVVSRPRNAPLPTSAYTVTITGCGQRLLSLTFAAANDSLPSCRRRMLFDVTNAPRLLQESGTTCEAP